MFLLFGFGSTLLFCSKWVTVLLQPSGSQTGTHDGQLKKRINTVAKPETVFFLFHNFLLSKYGAYITHNETG